MLELTIRAGRKDDSDWLFKLFRESNKDFIDECWGWDEIFQFEAFNTVLPGRSFRILEKDGDAIGGYHLAAKPEHFWLELILIEPGSQRQNYGSLLLDEAKQIARRSSQPILLSVLKINPAKYFYVANGFIETTSDKYSSKMEWRGETPTE